MGFVIALAILLVVAPVLLLVWVWLGVLRDQADWQEQIRREEARALSQRVDEIGKGKGGVA